MEQKEAPKSSGLEDQLRGMILGNVKITDGQAHQGPHAQRGRGRGRGGPWRGPHQQRPDQTREHGTNASSTPSVPSRGQGGNFNYRGRYRQSGPQTANHAHQGHGTAAAQTTSGQQAPMVLQRPNHDGNPTPQGRNNTMPPSNPRQQAPYQSRPNFNQPRENPMAQAQHLDELAAEEVPKVEMSLAELEEKEAFRQRLEALLQQAFADGYSGDISIISLVGFGSLSSGFAMPGSDMDLAIVPGWSDPSKADQIGIDRDIPRLFERAVLEAKMGGRLLTRTRVPILKVCEAPNDVLYAALIEERKKWDELPEEQQYPTDAPPEPSPQAKPLVDVNGAKPVEVVQHADNPVFGENFPKLGAAAVKKPKATPKEPSHTESTKAEKTETVTSHVESKPSGDAAANPPAKQNHQHHNNGKTWVREKVLGPLDFPKQGVGIQCDINFENPLGIHNTHLLRCYSLTDPRVRPIVLFVKAWAKRRKINSSYSGTLSSYGWVLMVLHYLVNIAQPPVCPNLQLSIPQPKDLGQLEKFFKGPIIIGGYAVRFWHDEQEIIQAAQAGQLSQNRQTIGALLRGFFQYYASLSAYGYGPRPPQFYWTNEVLSLRTPGGIRSKQDKGWVSAKTTVTAEKKVTNRYLFAIEDPFELDHNVARTVTHRGIVAIRDEFRRAWRILSAIGRSLESEGGIFDEVIEEQPAQPKVEAEPEVKKTDMEGVSVEAGEESVQKMDEPVVAS